VANPPAAPILGVRVATTLPPWISRTSTLAPEWIGRTDPRTVARSNSRTAPRDTFTTARTRRDTVPLTTAPQTACRTTLARGVNVTEYRPRAPVVAVATTVSDPSRISTVSPPDAGSIAPDSLTS
jgi:hypothetical protein